MPHKNYHEVSGRTHAEYGGELGKVFGASTRADIEAEKKDPHWARRMEIGRKLLIATQRYPELFGAYIDELLTFAEEAGIDAAELFLHGLEREEDGDGKEHCSTVITAQSKVVGQCEDFDEGSYQRICLLKSRIGEPQKPGFVEKLSLLYRGTLDGTALSANSHGIVHVVNSLPHKPIGEGVPRHVIARYLSDCANPFAAIKRIREILRNAGYSHTFIFPDGRVLNAECLAGKEMNVRLIGTPHVRTNHQINGLLDAKNPGIPMTVDADAPPLELEVDCSHQRLANLAAAVGAKPSMGVEEMKQLLSKGDGTGPDGIFNERTIARVIVDTAERARKMCVWLGCEPDKGWVEYPCP